MDAKTVPGQSGQPEKDLQNPGFESMQLVATPSPKLDYGEVVGGNKLQDTAPFENAVKRSNDSFGGPAMPRTSNDINGGADIFKNHGV